MWRAERRAEKKHEVKINPIDKRRQGKDGTRADQENRAIDLNTRFVSELTYG